MADVIVTSGGGAVTAAVGLVGAIIGAGIGAFVQYLVMRHQIKTQYSLAAIERRLDTQQQAFRLCDNLWSGMYQPDQRLKLIHVSRRWWLKKCIFLLPDSYKKMNDLMNKYTDYDIHPANNNQILNLTEQFKRTTKCILRESQLPSVNADWFLKKESEQVDPLKE
jgi:hypothetical protein